MTARIATAFFLALALVSGPALAKTFYKWVDSDGVTHYGNEAPQGSNASEVDTHTGVSSSAPGEQKALEQQRKQRQQEKKAQQEQKKLEQEKKDNPEKVSKEFCEQHRKNLETLQNRPIVREKDPKTGEMKVLTQEEKNQMVEETKKALEKCK